MLRNVKRNFFPYSITIDPETLKHAIEFVQMLRAAGYDPKGKDCMELGSGWAPVIPLIFYLAGCRSVTLVDIQRLMDSHTFVETCKQAKQYKQKIADGLGISTDEIVQKLNHIAEIPLGSAWEEMNWKYLSPFDITKEHIPDFSFDIVLSRAVLEHIPPAIINSILGVMYKILRPDWVYVSYH